MARPVGIVHPSQVEGRLPIAGPGRCCTKLRSFVPVSGAVYDDISSLGFRVLMDEVGLARDLEIAGD